MSKEAALEKNIYKKVFEATANIKFVESLKDKKDDDVVLVNSNWINGLIPVAARCIKEDHKRSCQSCIGQLTVWMASGMFMCQCM